MILIHKWKMAFSLGLSIIYFFIHQVVLLCRDKVWFYLFRFRILYFCTYVKLCVWVLKNIRREDNISCLVVASLAKPPDHSLATSQLIQIDWGWSGVWNKTKNSLRPTWQFGFDVIQTEILYDKKEQCPKAINCLNIRFDLPFTN